MTTVWKLGLAGVIVAAGIFGWRAWQDRPSNTIRLACEKVLKQRLKAPSTYKFVKTLPTKISQATLDEFMGWTTAGSKEAAMRGAETDPRIADYIKTGQASFESGTYYFGVTWLQYDAANAYGTPIREMVECSYVTRDKAGRLSPAERLNVRINGQTVIDWELDAVRSILGG